jgi:chemotaxis signal transduction protein
VPVRRLREVTPLTAPGAVPRGRHPFEAIHATRGELVPLVDVARLATGRAAPASARRFAVMVDDPEPFGLIAEHVSITEASARLSPPSASPEWVVGIDPTGVAYLDPVRLSSRLRDHGAAPPDTTATSPPPDEGAP